MKVGDMDNEQLKAHLESEGKRLAQLSRLDLEAELVARLLTLEAGFLRLVKSHESLVELLSKRG